MHLQKGPFVAHKKKEGRDIISNTTTRRCTPASTKSTHTSASSCIVTARFVLYATSNQPHPRAHPAEPHYLYALGRLEAARWLPEGATNRHRASRALMERHQDADPRRRAALDARQKPPAFYHGQVRLGSAAR